jgi:hypothetical protein
VKCVRVQPGERRGEQRGSEKRGKRNAHQWTAQISSYESFSQALRPSRLRSVEPLSCAIPRVTGKSSCEYKDEHHAALRF